jgi:hypothetical protein
LTLASREQEGDDWLARSLRSDVDALYRQRNTHVTLMHDYGWREDDGTPGTSELSKHSTLLHVDTLGRRHCLCAGRAHRHGCRRV